MQNDNEHLLVVEVEIELDLFEFDEIRDWKEKNCFLCFKHNGRIVVVVML